MASVLAILYFVVLTFFLGYSLSRLLKVGFSNKAEFFFMSIGVGLAIFPFIMTIFGWFSLIHWASFLVLALAFPLYEIIFLRKRPKLSLSKGIRFKKKHLYLLGLVLIFVAHFAVYLTGSFSYPYLEDGDPLHHAGAATYIAATHTGSHPADRYVFHYMDPYPPHYAGFMALELQLSDFDVNWVLKFFNSLIISLGIFFIFFFVQRTTKSSAKALTAAFFLALIPSFLSHFIFAASYATVLVPVGLWAIYLLHEAKKKEVTRHALFAGAIFSGIFLVQPIISALFLGVAGLFWLIFFRQAQTRKYLFYALALGLVLAQAFWTPMFITYGYDGVGEKLGFFMFDNTGPNKNNDSSGGVIYGVGDYAIAPKANKIDQPTGLGLALFVLAVTGIILFLLNYRRLGKKKDRRRLVLWYVLWTAILVVMLQANAFPYKFTPHRLWAFFSIGVVLLATWATHALAGLFKDRTARTIFFLIVVVAVIWTAGVPKYAVETAPWPPGPEWTTQEELQGYLWMQENLPRGTPVFSVCYDSRKVISSNMLGFPWDFSIADFRENIIVKTPEEIHGFAKSKGFSHLVMDTGCIPRYGANETQAFFQTIGGRTDLFTPVHFNNGFVLLQLN